MRLQMAKIKIVNRKKLLKINKYKQMIGSVSNVKLLIKWMLTIRNHVFVKNVN